MLSFPMCRCQLLAHQWRLSEPMVPLTHKTISRKMTVEMMAVSRITDAAAIQRSCSASSTMTAVSDRFVVVPG